jgi:RNA polymerase sigma-70 factor (ECF subfamily)
MILLVLPDISDEDRLLARARRGDQRAIMEIYEAYFPPILQFISFRVDDFALAEDIASDVFVRLISALRGSAAPNRSLRGWLFQVARSELQRHYGARKRLPVDSLDEWIPAPDHDEPEIQFFRALDAQQVRAALRGVSPEQQEVLVWRFAQGLSLEETADVMGKTTSAIKSLQFRAIEALRNQLTRAQTKQAREKRAHD